MRVGILQAGHLAADIAAQHGDYTARYSQLLGHDGFSYATYSVVDMEFPDGPEACDGWLITGSAHGAYDDLPFIAPLEQLIRDIYAAGRPLVGICFGHQIIAQALGGRVEKFDGGWATGRQSYQIGDQTLSMVAWHQDQVTRVPEDARVLGGSEFCENAVLAYGDSILTLQPHPEFDADFTRDLIEYRRGVVPDDNLAVATDGLPRPLDNTAAADMLRAVLRQKAHAS